MDNQLLYTVEETEALRNRAVYNYALPIVTKAFAKYPQINSACFAVAQFWNDVAYDEVHSFILHSVLDIPDWKAYDLSNEETDEMCDDWTDDDWDNYYRNTVQDPINLPDITEHQDIIGGNGDIFGRQLGELKKLPNLYDFDGLSDSMIAAFAAFCKEGSHQDMDYAEAYTPYALFTRTNTGIKIEIVGKMLRPWLDGIRAEKGY